MTPLPTPPPPPTDSALRIPHSALSAAPRTPEEFESLLCYKLLCAADQGLDRLLQEDAVKLTFADVAKALEIASKYARLAAERQSPGDPDANTPLSPEFKTALQKIYGPKPAAH